MKRLRAQLLFPLSCLIVITVLTVLARAQGGMVISARAGKVSYAGDDASVLTKGAGERRPVVPLMGALGDGDVVRTGVGGRVEVTLGPTAYLRLNENSEAELADGSPEGLSLKVTRGGAIIEAEGGAEFLAEVATPEARVLLLTGGRYRVNVSPGGETEVLAYTGWARLVGGKSTPTVLRSGEKAVIVGAITSVTKFDRKAEDVFDRWSGRRSELLAAELRRLTVSACREAMAAPADPDSFAHGYAPHLGFWSYVPASGSYKFHPPHSSRDALLPCCTPQAPPPGHYRLGHAAGGPR